MHKARLMASLSDMDFDRWPGLGLFLAAFTVLYFVAIKLGFEFVFVSEKAETVPVLWPASGLFMGGSDDLPVPQLAMDHPRGS